MKKFFTVGENSQLRSVAKDSNLRYIDNYAFYDCPKLSNLSLTDSTEVIGNNAFERTSSVKTFNLTKNLKDISENFFSRFIKKISIDENNKNIIFDKETVYNLI